MNHHGLTLGKYAPFHKGHQFVIETALSETDRVTVIIYDCPETTHVPLPVRSGWIRRLYPEVRVIEAWDGPPQVGHEPAVKRKHEVYIMECLGIREVTHFYSSEFYGRHMSRALGAVNRLVDQKRRHVPVSGSMIREDPYRYKHFLDPGVYRDLVVNVVFLGAPCSGKSSLAAALAGKYGTVWMPEYGREYWTNNHVDRRLTAAQLTEIAEGHLEREDDLLSEANRYLFTDTNALTTRLFCQHYNETPEPRLNELAGTAMSRYDLFFLCDIDFPYVDTWDRSGDADRRIFQKRVISDLRMRNIPFISLGGDLGTRMEIVEDVLQRYEKYMNYSELSVL